jgi:hypothetical protein
MTLEKVIVFDFDETIGNFQQIGIIYDILKEHNIKLTQKELYNLLDLFPYLLRPGLIELLQALKLQNIQTAIFTNNQAPPSWVNLFANYLSYNIGEQAFNHIVKSWKIDGKVVEKCRTSYDKKYTDFLSCTGYPKGTKLCFIDDRYHHSMNNKNVYYIHVKPYHFHYSFHEMIERLRKTKFGLKIEYNKPSIVEEISRYNFKIRKTKRDTYDYLITESLKTHIQYFMNDF